MSKVVDSSIPSRLKSIDLLRGCAALAVMIHHAMNYGDKLPEAGAWFRWLHAILDHGALGVPLFFVISGFCIHLRWARQYAEEGKAKLNFISFWKRRVYRLYPPYFVMLCLCMALVFLAYKMGKAVPLVTLYPDPKPRWMMLDFLFHATMLHGLHPLFDRGGGNPPFWTLAREEYFYIMYFGLLAWRWRWGMARATLLVFLLGLVFPFLLVPFLAKDSAWWSVIHSSAIVLWIQWCLGSLAVEVHYGLIKVPKVFTSFAMVLAWAGLALICDRWVPLLSTTVWGVTFFTLVNSCTACERSGQWPRHRLAEWLATVGVFSYSLYLIHNPVRAVMKQLLGPLARTESPGLYLMMVLLICIAGYTTAKIYFALIERRFLSSRANDRAATHGLSSMPVPLPNDV